MFDFQVREFKARKMKQFFSIDPADSEVVAIREKLEGQRTLQPPSTPSTGSEEDTR